MQLHHKLLITFLMVSLTVLATGVAGLFVVSKVGEDIAVFVEGKVAVADAAGEIASIVTSEAILHEHMLTSDPDGLDQIQKKMNKNRELDDMWIHAIIYGSESREFINSKEYQLWQEYGYGKMGIVVRKAEPEIMPMVEELHINHEKFHDVSGRLTELHREMAVLQQNLTDRYPDEKTQRYRMRDIVRAQDDYLLSGDMGWVDYASKEALFQYRDKKHTDEWIETVEILQRDVANSTLAPGIKSEIQDYSIEYLSLVRAMSRDVLRLNELDVETRAQANVIEGHIAAINANIADIRAVTLAARTGVKTQIAGYITNMLGFLAVLTVLAIALIMSVGYLTNKFISQPILKLRDATRKTGEGDVDVRIKVDRGDEIGELGTAFNEMAEALKKRTAELAEHAEELERTNRFRETFTDILRHDLLNPIGVIGNIMEILEDDKNLRDSSEFHVIKRNVKKLEEIVYNASDYAKLESTEKLEKTELDLAKVIESVIEDFGPYIKDKGMNVEFKPEGEYKASASPTIESVFVNLLSNAIKYSPEGSEIKIAIEDGGKSWKISFADRGDGVPDEYKEAIFDRFTRKDKVGVRGTGFGLAIVKRIVEMHGGNVWVEDNLKGGSIFYVEIPK